MPSHRSHDFPYIEPERHDELSGGVKVDPPPASTGSERREDGTFAPGVRVLSEMGGRASKRRTKLSHDLDLGVLGPTWAKRARTLRRALSSEIASGVGGGECGVAASLFLKFASQKTAAAERAFQAGEYESFRKLSESARMDVLYAREHAAKEAAAKRAMQPATTPLAALRASVADEEPSK